ncbi:hypothetical protein MTR67_003170 [Solanum verrucosum]|uniref:DUF4283 domain-containing protein n=1 Tax=Solanum verrucosum TaxID=315347 RepID=A0AAF0PTT4_SOLVR|nr:hypothetical protein MTR67_003170 [Solanum verrucosum]
MQSVELMLEKEYDLFLEANKKVFFYRQFMRVKVYRLNDDGKWDDQGTGHVTVDYLERSEEPGLLVTDEHEHETLLMHRISAEDIYRKQEVFSFSQIQLFLGGIRSIQLNWLLVFKRPLAAHTYGKDSICSVQRNMQFSSLNYETFHSASSDLRELPPVELSTLPLILKIVVESGVADQLRVTELILHDLYKRVNGSQTLCTVEIKSRIGNIKVTDRINDQEDSLLKRCVVGYCREELKEKPTLADIRRWSSTNWKKAFGVNIYEFNGDSFLFEFPNKHMAEQTLKRQWRWKNCSFHMEWWNPFIGRIPNSLTVKEIWITLVGIPLHLRSQKVFREIGGVCGGWIATEEETELKNQMKWARILVASDGRKIPKEVSIEWNEITYHFPIWVECKPRFEIVPESGYGTNGEETRPKSTLAPEKKYKLDSAGQLIFNKIYGGNNLEAIREENAMVESEARGS